jgi:ubiquinone/menaquinone biosynthesis C-methylase UbiE
MSLMKKTILPDPAIEHLLTQLRKILLETFVEGKTHFGTQNSVLYALAMHCFLNEYVYYATKEEIAQIEALCKKFDLNHPALVAMIGCYRPLYTLVQNSTSWKGNDAYQQLMILQVAHPLEEQNLEIPSYGGIKNAISKKVKAQYESAPYPRWFGLYSSEPTTIPQFFKKMFPNLQEALSFPEIPQILIAGCGTGQQAFNTANTFRNSQVLAVDLSRASLAYAKRKQQELHIENIQFLQADILEIDVPVQFDLIECIGVLHHLENPMEGLRHLERMLKPGGWMEIGLYSETARQDIVAARQFISENGYGSTDDDIRQCRQDLLALPLDHPAKSVAQTIDFFTLSGCRDLLFHVQECRFTLQEIAKMLKSLHLEFIGFELRDKTLKRKYLEQFPHDPLAISLDNWGQFEEENPLTFIGMYQFWIRKKKIY